MGGRGGWFTKLGLEIDVEGRVAKWFVEIFFFCFSVVSSQMLLSKSYLEDT
jgi:hypothetical protein